MRIFETLMAHRYKIAAEESVSALNSIDVIFYKEKNVRDAYKEFLAETNKVPFSENAIEEKHLKLLETMSKDLKLNEIHWDDIKHKYYPNGLSEKDRDEDMLRKLQIKNAAVALQNNNQGNNSTNNIDGQQIALQLLPELLKNPESLKAIMEFAKQNNISKNK